MSETGSTPGVRFDAVLFDVDGTLVDSIPYLVECFQQAVLETFGSEVAAAEILPMVGMPLVDMFARVRPNESDALLDRCAEAYTRIYLPNVLTRSMPFEDSKHVLSTLARAGVRIGVVSGKMHRGIARVLVPAGLFDFCEYIVGADHAGRPKPAPDGALAAARALGVEPARTLVVGDSLLDVEMGISAGMVTCGVTTGTTARAELEARAHAVVDRLADVLPLVL